MAKVVTALVMAAVVASAAPVTDVLGEGAENVVAVATAVEARGEEN